MHHSTRRRAALTFLAGCAAGLSVWVSLDGASASAATPAGAPPTIYGFPLGVGGVVRNSDGSSTLWVLNTQTRSVVINGHDIFSIVDVTFNETPGYRLKLKSGTFCTPPSVVRDASTIECLPDDIRPQQLVPVVTFTTNRPVPAGKVGTMQLGAAEGINPDPVVGVPASAHTPAAIRAVLNGVFKKLHIAYTNVFVTAHDDSFTLSRRTVPRGWVTFVTTNRGTKDHDFELCPNSGDLPACLGGDHSATLTGVIAPGETQYVTIHITTPGSYEYLSGLLGQSTAGLKGSLKVT